jgi:hypothetical protein
VTPGKRIVNDDGFPKTVMEKLFFGEREAKEWFRGYVRFRYFW